MEVKPAPGNNGLTGYNPFGFGMDDPNYPSYLVMGQSGMGGNGGNGGGGGGSGGGGGGGAINGNIPAVFGTNGNDGGPGGNGGVGGGAILILARIAFVFPSITTPVIFLKD